MLPIPLRQVDGMPGTRGRFHRNTHRLRNACPTDGSSFHRTFDRDDSTTSKICPATRASVPTDLNLHRPAQRVV